MSKKTSFADQFKQVIEKHVDLLGARDQAAAEIDRLKDEAAGFLRRAEEFENAAIDHQDPVEAARQHRENRQAAEDLRQAARQAESQLTPAQDALELAEKRLHKAVVHEISELAKAETSRVSQVVESALDDLDLFNAELPKVAREYGIRGSFPSRPVIPGSRRLDWHISSGISPRRAAGEK